MLKICLQVYNNIMKKTKIKTSFVCQECGYDTTSWLGKCPECGSWNSLREFKTQSSNRKTQNSGAVLNNVKPQRLSEVKYETKSRIQTGFSEFDNVIGGGIVKGSVSLIAGDPGVGKSTLLLQLALNLAIADKKILYVSGEESSEQIKMRAVRIASGKKNPRANNQEPNLLLLSQTNTDEIVIQIEETKPDLVIIDSIQTIESENVSGLAGSVGQVRYSALQFVRIAKQNNIPVIIVGHVTKEGMVAGPMVLSHMVDTVLFFEGEKFSRTKILRSLKNRFGPVDEVGIFQMVESGIEEATNLEQLFLTGETNVPGSVLVATLEGSRVFMVEIQGLIVSSGLPVPRHVVSGIDPRRVELLLAVLQKHAGLSLSSMDVFVNVAGGIKLSDPGIDLAVCLAIFSSLKNIALTKVVGISEVGLLGELRSVVGLEKRVKEAQKLGFKKIITAKTNKTISEVIRELGK